MEFGVKSLYATLIKMAAESTYGETDKQIYLTVSEPALIEPAEDAASPGIRSALTAPKTAQIIASDGSRHVMAVPRWGGFTEAVPAIADAGYEFRDISGNQRIAVSLIVSKGVTTENLPALRLFSSKMVSDDSLERIVLLVRNHRRGVLLRTGRDCRTR